MVRFLHGLGSPPSFLFSSKFRPCSLCADSAGEGRDCSELLQIISAARGAVNSLMTELLEGHIRQHVLDPKRKPNSEQTHAADEVIDMVKTYLK